MEIVHNSQNENIKKPELEQVDKEKHEWKLIGKFIRKRGLKLWAYCPATQMLYQVDEQDEPTIEISVINGILQKTQKSPMKATISTNRIQFEALNQKSAIKRVERYQTGKLKDLCNLKRYDPDAMKDLKMW